jgi:transposase
MLFVRAYPRETQEMAFDAHDWAFALFKGACGRGIYDNMKTAIPRSITRFRRLLITYCRVAACLWAR